MIVAALMIFFGLAEVATSFTHNFFGLTTVPSAISTSTGAAIGLCYLVGGLLILSGRKWAAAIAIALLIADVVGRVVMMLTGLYPFDSPLQKLAMVIGTAIAACFALYIGSQWNCFE